MISDRDYIDKRMDDLFTHFTTLRAADAAALYSARDSLNSRLAGMNEFRQQLSEQTRTFMPRVESESQWQRTGQRLDSLATEQRTFVGRGEHDALAERINGMEVRMTRAEGTDSGAAERTASLRSTIVTSVAVAGLVLTLVLALVGYVLR